MNNAFSFQNIELISSPQNPKFKIWKNLLNTKGRKKEQLFILSGEKIIKEFLNSKPLSSTNNIIPVKYRLKALLLPNTEESYNDLHHLLHHENPNTYSLFRLESTLFNELDTIGTHFPLLVIEYPQLPNYSLDNTPQGLEIICPVGDPSNLGAILRSASAFGIKKVILTKNAADPFHPKSLKSSSGAALKLHIEKIPLDLAEIQQESLKSFDLGLDLAGQDISQFTWPQNCRLWLGEEGPGLNIFPKKQCLTIPITQMESLNVSVAAGISLFSYLKQHQELK